ncbi:hypothetical protein K438DRAFT_1986933 [Mycena galopus ATCC 62051]|nr:hypothetical protein K438DRAFT_1986933 [Mycena galopus ATCC 62051]
MLEFLALRELWGDGPLPPPPLGTCQYIGGPCTSPPFVGPVIDAHLAEAKLIRELLYEGKSPPAHRFTEVSTPPRSPWWPPEIQCLHDKVHAEARELKDVFLRQYPPRYRVVDTVFLRNRAWLVAHLVQEGLPPSEAAALGAGPGT